MLNSIRPFTRCPTIEIPVIRVLDHRFLCLVLQVANVVKFHVTLLQRGVREDAVEFRMIDIAAGGLPDAPEVQVRLDIISPESIAIQVDLPLVRRPCSPSHPRLLPATRVRPFLHDLVLGTP